MKKRILLASAMGISGGLLYLLSRKGKLRAKKAARMGGEENAEPSNDNAAWDLSATGQLSEELGARNAEENNQILDDHGTDQVEAANILKRIRDAGFDSSDEKLALALGRPTEEIEAWTSGAGHIDGDVILKARGLAIQRGIETGL